MKFLDEVYVKELNNPSAELEMVYLEDTYIEREATCRACGLLIIS